MRTIRPRYDLLLLLIPVAFFSCVTSFSQTYDQLKTQLQFENFYGAKMRSTRPNFDLVGPEFLFDNWLPIEITFQGGSTQFNQGKLSLVSSGAEVVYKDKEMIISPSNIKMIRLLNENRWFIPGPKYYYKDVAMQGMMEIFDPTQSTPYILLRHFVYVKEPSSNGYISGGSTERRLVRSSDIYLHNGTSLVPIKGKGSLSKYYKSNKQLFQKLSKELNTDFRNAQSMQELVNPHAGSSHEKIIFYNRYSIATAVNAPITATTIFFA